MNETPLTNESSFNRITPKEVLASAFGAFNQPVFESIIKVHDVSSFDELRKYLAGKIAEMMDRYFEMPLSSLYRIDINEEKVSSLFSGDNKEFIPEKLADLIIERQMQKLYYRNLYRQQAANLRLD